jgi:hypothetical protein
VESHQKLILDGKGIKDDYLGVLKEHRDKLKDEATKANIDYVGMDTSVSFDKAMLEYLIQRQRRF